MLEGRRRSQLSSESPDGPQQRAYSLETIIRLQNLLAGGIPEEFAGSSQSGDSICDEIAEGSLDLKGLAARASSRERFPRGKKADGVRFGVWL
jgi:hypothetical protein